MPEGFFIDGAWETPAGRARLPVIDPSRDEPIGEAWAGEAADVDRAVAAAREAFAGWSSTPVAERADILSRVAQALESRADEVAETICREIGMPLSTSRRVQATLPVGTFRSMARVARGFSWAEDRGRTRIVREPIGVCGLITPWNFPLHQIAGKVAPALTAGCTAVLKPSEIAPGSATILAEAFEAVGLPAGVFNLVHGEGPVAGAALSGHPEIDMISFTGSTRGGVAVAQAAAPTVKRVTQELGGKSANIILDDADLERAVRAGARACFFNSGQACNAPTRMLVPKKFEAQAIDTAHSTAEAVRVGDPFDPDTTMGPLASRAQLDKVRSMISMGLEEGARLVAGGVEAPAGLETGFFVQPTVFAEVTNDMTIAREEIFGPVLSILSYRDDEEAIAIANDSDYGLSAYVQSGDSERARRVALQLRAGQVQINGAPFDTEAPFGGYKRSGNGREFGRWGLEEYLETKAIVGW